VPLFAEAQQLEGPANPAFLESVASQLFKAVAQPSRQ
jgi:hypothetical protein